MSDTMDHTHRLQKAESLVECQKHKASLYMPCGYVFYATKDEVGHWVCNKRLQKAGYVGKPSDRSTRVTSRSRG